MTETETTSAHVVTQSFTDFEQLAEVVLGWRLDLCQLDRGGFRGDLLQCQAGETLLSHAYFSRRLRQNGHPPEGMRTLIVPGDANFQACWRGKEVRGSDLALFPAACDLSAVSGPAYSVYTISVSDEALALCSETVGGGRSLMRFDRAGALRCDPAAVQEFRAFIRIVCEAIARKPELLGHPAFRAQLESDLLRRFLSTAHDPQSCRDISTSALRSGAIAKVEDQMACAPDDPVTITDLCEVAGVSERTLDYAFREHYGISPKAYVLAVRLNGTFRELHSEENVGSIAAVAGRWGFWHMGQFAAVYRRHFGELPSQTRARTVGRRSMTDADSLVIETQRSASATEPILPLRP